MSERPPVAFLAWSSVAGRSAEIAEELGGVSRCYYDDRLRGGWRTIVRYALSAAATAGFLLARRPRAVIATNPPVFVGLIAWAYGVVARAPVLLDSHPSSFGLKQSRAWARLLPVHAWLARRTRATLVTTADLAAVVRRWGGRPLLVHEAPADWVCDPGLTGNPRPRVLFVTLLSSDEPVAEVADAARLLPEVDVWITGDPSRRGASLPSELPDNVVLTGFLDHDRYHEAVRSADLVLALTTEPTSVMRSAYEAVYAGRPLLVSDWPDLRALFPYAEHAANEPQALAAGIRRALDHLDDLRALAPEARRLQEVRWGEQRAALLACIGTDPVERPRDEPRAA